ncbi:Conserved_hypothetical protein [Hexamita inflata]|uniref:Leucine rich repeats-containing protein n=1 Tax=Hexamita inflata TaxID=28002 RepID=A0ABP1H7K4_9EUKA
MQVTSGQISETSSTLANSEKIYIQTYTVRNGGEISIYNEQNLTTFEFVDKISFNHVLQIQRCFNISFKTVPNCIRILFVNDCNLERLNGLSQMRLFELDLSNNKINDISELKRFQPGLKALNLSDNLIVDVSIFVLECLKLIKLDLSDNKIINIDALKDQSELQELFLYNNYIQDLTPAVKIAKKIQQYQISGARRARTQLQMSLDLSSISQIAFLQCHLKVVISIDGMSFLQYIIHQ